MKLTAPVFDYRSPTKQQKIKKMQTKRWTKDQLQKFKLQEEDLYFLIHNGLEIRDFGCIRINELYEYIDGNIIIGYDNDFPVICLNKGVFLSETDCNRFVNSSLNAFTKSIIAFSEYCEKVTGSSGQEYEIGVVNQTIERMKNIDIEAWRLTSNYWPVIGQQMLEGNQ